MCRMCSNIEGIIFGAFLRVRTFFIGGVAMSVYKKMYLSLFNSITDALEETDVEKIKQILIQAQIKTEEMYIDSDEE